MTDVSKSAVGYRQSDEKVGARSCLASSFVGLTFKYGHNIFFTPGQDIFVSIHWCLLETILSEFFVWVNSSYLCLVNAVRLMS